MGERQLASEKIVVIGAGPAGLASAGSLAGRRDRHVTLIERSGEIGTTWAGHYDRLRLHTIRWLSGLPGLAIPRRFGKWVARDDYRSYLVDYAEHHRLDVRYHCEALEVVPGSRHPWDVRTSDGTLAADRVVIATGFNRAPRLPEVMGIDAYAGELLHSSAYRHPRLFAGKDVLVIGSGNSGAEIATDLAEGGASRVRIAVRTGPHVLPRDVLGMPSQLSGVFIRQLPRPAADVVSGLFERVLVGDLTPHGLPRPTRGAYSQVVVDNVIPILDTGFVAALKRGAIEAVPAVSGFTQREVRLRDGSTIEPDVVIAATGFEPGLAKLVGHLGVLGGRGAPLVHGACELPSRPGLHFVGFTQAITGNLFEIRIQAGQLAKVRQP